MADIAKLEALNADHHRRMAADKVEIDPKRLAKVQKQDRDSRENILRAMKGCAGRMAQSLVYAPQPPVRVLELGAGYCGDRAYLAEVFGAEYTGIEVVRAVAERSGALHMAIEQMPAEWTGCFDWIYSRHVLEHVIDVKQALREICRVLKPHGIMGAVTPHYFPDPEPAHVTQFKIDAWRKVYSEHGLRPVYAVRQTHVCDEAHIVTVRDDLPVKW
jgi:SAM-dependent methyltransferase